MKYFISLLAILCFTSDTIADITHPVSLRDKVGQMLIIGFKGKHIDKSSQIVKMIQQNNIGGVILFDYDTASQTYDRNIENPAQLTLLNQALQHYNEQGHFAFQRPQLPLLITVDYEGGKVNRLKESFGFPVTVSAATIGTQSFEEAEQIAQSMANTLQATGFNLNFAPVLDVNTNPDNPIIGKVERSYSSDASLVSRYASMFAHHYLTRHIQCAYKHFPGHGSSTGDSHLGFVDVTNTWQPYELTPYYDLLNSNESCGMIMTAHIVNRQLDASGLPATLSYKILTDLLRQQMHFQGVIVTDDMQMKAISANYDLPHSLVLAINAGADMLIFGNNLQTKSQDPNVLIDIIVAKVESGEISAKRVDEAYQHILALKKSLIHQTQS